jgi:hypothetical protein
LDLPQFEFDGNVHQNQARRCAQNTIPSGQVSAAEMEEFYEKLNQFETKAAKRMLNNCKYEDYAISAYEKPMQLNHVNFELKRRGLFINKEFPYIHATPDFLVSCD